MSSQQVIESHSYFLPDVRDIFLYLCLSISFVIFHSSKMRSGILCCSISLPSPPFSNLPHFKCSSYFLQAFTEQGGAVDMHLERYSCKSLSANGLGLFPSSAFHNLRWYSVFSGWILNSKLTYFSIFLSFIYFLFFPLQVIHFICNPLEVVLEYK